MDAKSIKKGPTDLRPIVGGRNGSTGPRSEEGRWRSAGNALRHGLGATHALLPGEDRAIYEQRLDALFQSLAPRNDGEAQLVALIGDLIWRLERAAKIERGLMLGRIEDLLAQTDTFARAQRTAVALKALGDALVLWETLPVPSQRNRDYDRRYRMMADAVDDVGEQLPELALDSYAQCHGLLVQLNDRLVHPELSAALYAKVDQVARSMMAQLIQRGEQEEAGQRQLREAIAGIALPDKNELVKLAKYVATLEASLTRSLQALDQLRNLSESVPAIDAERAREFRLRLRVVA